VNRRRFTKVYFFLILALCCALLLPLIWNDIFRNREGSSTRLESANRLKQIGIGFQTHNEVYDALPPATTFDETGQPLYGWTISLLPFVEQNTLYQAIDRTKAWNDPVNQHHTLTQLRCYRYSVAKSSVDADGYPITTYAANIHALGGEKPRKLSDFPNGGSNVLLVGEVQGNFKAWGYPLNVRDPKLGLKKSPDGFGGPWRTGTQFLMADGSVRAFHDDTDPEFLKLLAEP
jgi:hypothetical protein